MQIKCRGWQGLILCDLCLMTPSHTREGRRSNHRSLLLRLKVERTVPCSGCEPNLKSGFSEICVLSAQPQSILFIGKLNLDPFSHSILYATKFV